MSALAEMMEEIPSIGGWDVEARTIPARTFTGDFYLTRKDAAGNLWFALGDVAGKGLNAAVFMAMTAEELEAVIDEAGAESEVSEVVCRVSRSLRELLPFNRFVTLVAGRITECGRLEIVNAGHCPPVIVRANGTVEVIRSHGPIVGLLPFAQWSSERVVMSRGDRLVLYSDGVLEAVSPDGVELGLDGVIGAVTARAEARETMRTLLSVAQAHTTRWHERDDDTTAMVLARR